MQRNLKNDCAKKHYIKELTTALANEKFQELLQGDAGSFSIRYLFINEYINYINQIETNPSYKPTTPKRIEFIRLFTLIWRILEKKRKKPIDFLFISRDRKVKVKVESGYLEGDYIFYSVINHIRKNYPNYDLKLYALDESYTKYYCATPQDFARSSYMAIHRFVKWNWYKRAHHKDPNDSKCDHVASTADYFFHPRNFLRLALMGYSMGRMFSVLEPKVIISNDDCIYTKPLNSDAKMIVLQSARMLDYLEECRKVIFQKKRLKPDYYLSSGKVFAELKEKCQAAEKIVVTGLPRYDVLGKARKIYSRPEFVEKYGINPHHKIVHWSTQCHVLSDEENTANFREVFGAIKSLQNVTLVIKQHPAEEERYTKEIKKSISECGVNVVITPKESDTYEQLFVCDLMMTKTSTTAMEAVALGKPVIILNLSSEPDPVEYVKEGVAIGVYRTGDLRTAIERLLHDDSGLAAKRDGYIGRYLYKVDGNATSRVVEIIMTSLDSAGSKDAAAP